MAVVPHAVDPLGMADAAMGEGLHTLFAMLRGRLAGAVGAGDAVPFGAPDPRGISPEAAIITRKSARSVRFPTARGNSFQAGRSLHGHGDRTLVRKPQAADPMLRPERVALW